jgi:hypothetical protein
MKAAGKLPDPMKIPAAGTRFHFKFPKNASTSPFLARLKEASKAVIHQKSPVPCGCLILATILGLLPAIHAATPDPAKPWTRWWWLGSGVDEKNLTRQLEDFARAGIGGVEICPIYGARGYEDRDIDFLSPRWTAMLAHTSRECQRLGLGLDLTTGTGWPFGGPWVTPENASRSLQRIRQDFPAGNITLTLPKGHLECLMAYPKNGAPIDLAPRVNHLSLDWHSEQPVRIRGIVSKSPIQQVKRAAPGGAGHVVDPFSAAAIKSYLARFDDPLAKLGSPAPRAHFHDSFEYYGADWTPGLLGTFEKQHGYDLRHHLPAFFGEDQPAEVSRVSHDYRETLDLLHRSYLETWHDWAARHGSLTRNQAHGSPGNLLDHYAVADIPETEIFRHVAHEQIPMLQFAASAAHLTGRNLVSAESFTWLGEHFQVKPAALKEAADFLWLGGVNHIFYHGIPYSPADATWPGWLFYASTHMGENGGLWRDLPVFNQYIHTVQSVLQSGRPDTAVLLYWPVHDIWSQPAAKLPLLTIHNQNEWLHGTSFHATAMALWENGIPCDFVSDRLLETATVRDGMILLGGKSYKLLILPESTHPPDSLNATCSALTAKGATITSIAGFPEPGEKPDSSALLQHLEASGIHSEPMTSHGLRFVRRITETGCSWFIVNPTDHTIDAWAPLSSPFRSALFIDPAKPDRKGTPNIEDGKIRFHLEAGESRILHSSSTLKIGTKPWFDFRPSGTHLDLSGPWNIDFIAGGPELPASAELPTLDSWTTLGEAARNFSGTARYTTTFSPPPAAGSLALDLGQVAETCRVTLNGKPLGTSFFPPHRFELTNAIKEGENTLSVEVTNLAANRIADADRRGVKWKAFHEINFVNIDYQPFDASTWKPLPSGLLGPVRLYPIER